MNLFTSKKTGPLAYILGGLTAFVVGCVITTGNGDTSSNECGSIGSHSEQVGDECLCDAGYEFCNDNPDDFDCCKIPPKVTDNMGTCGQNSELIGDECFCDAGFNWCSDDPNDLNCCEDDKQVSGTGETDTGTDTEGGTDTDTGEPVICEEAQQPPESCDPNTELAFCTNPAATCTPENSEYYLCNENGEWELQSQADNDAVCKLDFGDDSFAFGCLDEGEEGVFLECADPGGPGTACNSNAPDFCDEDPEFILSCVFGRLTSESCLTICQGTEGPEGFYDIGECGEQDGKIDCLCDYQE